MYSYVSLINIRNAFLTTYVQIIICVALLSLLIKCMCFIHRFKSGKISLSHSVDAQSAIKYPLFNFLSPLIRSSPCPPTNLALNLPGFDREHRVLFRGRHYNFMFPSFLHFKTQNPSRRSINGTVSAKAIAFYNKANTNKASANTSTTHPSTRPVLLQAISEPYQRSNLSESDSPFTEVNIAPLCFGQVSFLTNAFFLLSEEPEFKMRAPLAEPEYLTEVASETRQCRKGPSIVESRARNIDACPPPIRLSSEKINIEQVFVPETTAKSQSHASVPVLPMNATKSTHKLANKTKASARASISMVCRLCFFGVFHALFALLLITGDVGLSHLMLYYHEMDLEVIHRSQTIFCRTTFTAAPNSFTFTPTPPSRIPSSTRTTEQSGLDNLDNYSETGSQKVPPLIDGGVEVHVVGREVKVPFELNIQTRDCLVAPHRPETTPLLMALFILLYAVIFLGIVGEKRFVHKASIRIVLAIYGEPKTSPDSITKV